MSRPSTPKPPIATQKPHQLKKHGDLREDPYFWLNQREDPEVLDYLKAENTYYQEMTAHTLPLQEALFAEMKGRIKEDDRSVPYKKNGYWYGVRYELGQQYPVYFRHEGSLDAPEEILFDVNEMAEGHDYFHLRGISISPDNQLVSYGVDTVSRRQYQIRIKDLQGERRFDEVIENTTGSAAWSADGDYMFYTRKDPVTLRSAQVFRHRLGSSPEEDVLVYEETDDTFSCGVYRSKSREYLIITSSSTLTTEFRILPTADPLGEFKVFSPRQRGIEYGIYHYDQHFYILTNKDGATNFKLMRCPEEHTHIDQWEEFIPHRKEVLLEDFELFNDFYVLTERHRGLNRMYISKWKEDEGYYLPFEGETYVAGCSTNPDFDSTKLRYVFNAMTAPYKVIERDLLTGEEVILKEGEVQDPHFSSDNYESKREWALAEDGTKIPVSLIYRKDLAFSGERPVLLYAYGSYGSTIDPHFSTTRLSLLDRGFIYAIAHVRGGEYLGRSWYEDGKLLKKQNTFTDFIACGRHLIQEGYTNAAHLYAQGGSAGGLLIGAVINRAPQLFNGAIAAVPFVDVVTTMLDDSIPLTTSEYDEWGNPNEEEYYRYMKSYSPYDNVREQDYPHLYVSTGLHDSQVQYWEPAKWVARLRQKKTDQNLLFLDTDMEAGHGGASGRFNALKDKAKEFAFLLDLEGIKS